MAALEAKAARASNFLETTYEQLKQLESPDAVRWLEETAKLQAHSSKTSTVIGVIGATGAGKSALVNALLDEERVLPTNCMRACTAVVTEISYNDSDIPYRAEIEFISKDDWRLELGIMFGDLLDAHGNISANSSHEDNEAGVAYSKLRAVYPGITREQIARASVDTLMAHKSMVHLGTTKVIEEGQADLLYKKLQVYIDSREKVDLRLKSAKMAPGVLEFWPLIKVVRLFVKSRALRSGAILVDLPGVHDSNAARAAVAQSYLKQCSGLFIVAPINRAVDDKSAKTLLGQSFKQQLKLDGNFGNITFICSKTDEIAVFEAQENLGLGEELAPLHRELNAIEESMSQLATVIGSLKSALNAAEQADETADLELEIYQSQLLRANEGKELPKASTLVALGKRKRASVVRSRRTKVTIKNYFEIDSEDDQQDDAEEEADIVEIEDPSTNSEQPLTKTEIEQKISELRVKKDLARSERHKLAQLIKIKEQEPRINKKRHSELRSEIMRLCVTKRNEYSRAAIRQDFADGIREIDQELAEENDPENFDPTEAVRDYDEVAQSLSVFCVSSRQYQKLIGNLKTEKKVLGFENSSVTEIPQLQDHCLQVAEALQASAFEAFLGKVVVLCNSLRIWTLNQGQNNLTEDELSRRETTLRTELQHFTKNLLAFSESIISAVKTDIRENISSKFDAGIKKASGKATGTVIDWGRPVDRDNREASGLHFQTYTATTRRNGYFPKRGMTIDFNRELADPLINHITHGWERVFVRLAPAIFIDARQNSEALFDAFRTRIDATASQHGISGSSLRLLEQQLNAHASTFKDAINVARLALRDQQKEINRQFIPAITDSMSQIYAECATQRGTGMFNRVKKAMEGGVQEGSEAMFRACTRKIEDDLQQMVEDIQQDLLTKTQDITTWIERDYLELSSKKSQQILHEEKLLKDIVLRHVNEYESESSWTEIAPIKVEDDTERMNSSSLPVRPSPSNRCSMQPNSSEDDHIFASREKPAKTLKLEDDDSAEDIPFRSD